MTGCPHCGSPNPISPALRQWLLSGERGVSSEAIVSHLTGIPIGRRHSMSPPSDPSDLRRCRLMLEAVPELAPRIGEMATVSKQWAAIAAVWDDVCRTMDEECPDWRRGGPCPRTWALMSTAIYGSPPRHLRFEADR
jgi:hypothetical protein